ncbi:MAG: glycine zipper 2TM domain-containing protein [Polaromonas sp.]
MNTSNDSMQPGQQSASSSGKPLWAAVGILGVAVLGMGGTMIYQQRTPAPVAPAAQVALATPQVAGPAAGASAADDLIEKPAAAPAKPAPVVAKKVVKPKPQPVPQPAPAYAGVSPAPSPYPVQAPVVVHQVCTVCGSIESVTPVQRSTKSAGPGMGAVAGGVLGAVLGNQVGSGNGKTAATILGAIGGGFAGNAVEKNVRKETVYQVGVRMEDGSRRTIEVAQPPSVGSRVTVEGSSIRSSDGVTYRAPAPVAAPVNQPAFSQPGQ